MGVPRRSAANDALEPAPEEGAEICQLLPSTYTMGGLDFIVTVEVNGSPGSNGLPVVATRSWVSPCSRPVGKESG